jgi:hypothetical protein
MKTGLEGVCERRCIKGQVSDRQCASERLQVSRLFDGRYDEIGPTGRARQAAELPHDVLGLRQAVSLGDQRDVRENLQMESDSRPDANA